MIARLFPPFLRELDRWWLQRMPMFWRTRLMYALLLLLLLGLLSLLYVPHVISGFESAKEIDPIASLKHWDIHILCAAIAIGLWVLCILRWPVGELPLRRHFVTFVAVAIGGYLWLVAPSLLALAEIRAIANIELSAEDLDRDRSVLSLYRDWQCVPKDVFDKERKKLFEVYKRYGYLFHSYSSPPANANDGKCEDMDKDANFLRVSDSEWRIRGIRRKIDVILDARSFWTVPTEENQFLGIRESLFSSLLVAVGIGTLTVLLSYPLYVWHRLLRV